MDLEDPSSEKALALWLAALGSPVRLGLLKQLRAPRVLRELHVRSVGPDSESRLISRQAVREHLERLIEIGVVLPRETEREDGTVEYSLNHQRLFAISEEFRALARLRPASEPAGETIRADRPPAPFEIRGPCLVLVKGLDEGQTFRLPPPATGKAEWVIGRRRGLAVSLDFDPFISTENSSIVYEDGTHFVRDLPESSNGTMLNFQLLPKGVRHALRTGDLIGVGRSLLMFRA